jgi:hypothetical protein
MSGRMEKHGIEVFKKALSHPDPDNWIAHLSLTPFSLSEMVGFSLSEQEASLQFIQILQKHAEARHWVWLGEALHNRDILSQLDQLSVKESLKFIEGTLKFLSLKEQRVFLMNMLEKVGGEKENSIAYKALRTHFSQTRRGLFAPIFEKPKAATALLLLPGACKKRTTLFKRSISPLGEGNKENPSR